MQKIKLPSKTDILNWNNESVTLRVMKELKMNRAQAKQWFTDFMCWLYSAQRWRLEKQKSFMMDSMNYLDEVWHAYILHTRDYLTMSKELFGIECVHHNPENPFKGEPMDPEVFEQQLLFLIDDWGEEYIDRVWAYGNDVAEAI
ncbi:hypothetical protein [Francisella sp. LA112445]|uniref:hypothetical protein n=1 Tax=Francisella sp. LA112445 TaxID=1395624 RepID=UPI001788BCAD|nr:hypothetical protein [Francisella sp. LA112445]QIW10699.1 hypothetical protein FIP56_08280 [Francisella sp. LA112445]